MLPGAAEAANSKKGTAELAMIIDAFYPLRLTPIALGLEKPEYKASWLEGNGD
jgi:homogentisate 1,2-dioxygenase